MSTIDQDFMGIDSVVECLAIIVGPNHFQNTLFAAYIETHSRCKSVVVDCVSPQFSPPGNCSPSRTAVLYDCFGLTRSILEESVLAGLEQIPPDWLPVLFNLDRNVDIETKALGNGVHGFFYQHDAIETLLKGLSTVFGGEFWVSRRKMADVILENGFRLRHRQSCSHNYPHELTRREVEILGLLTLGASNGVIADKLFISPNTVRTHLNNIFRKIKVMSRLEASVWASRTLFKPPAD